MVLVEQLNICKHCPYSDMCSVDLSFLNNVSKSLCLYEKGDYLFKAGQQFDGFYVFCEGTAKAMNPMTSNKIMHFYHPGDLIGLCGFGDDTYKENVRFLKSSRVYKISKSNFEAASMEKPELAHKMIKLLSQSIVRRQNGCEQDTLLDTEARLLLFLQEQKNHSRNPRGLESFTLSMSRVDIANYLGVAVETVSRLMQKLNKEGIICTQHRDVRLPDKLSTSNNYNRASNH